jgi:NAD(P)H-hydrate epimerase
MILTCAEMKALEERAFADGVSAEALMEEAGAQIAAAVRQFFPQPGRCVVFFGKGHNGGDALVAARHLAALGWHLEFRAAFAPETWSDLTRKKRNALPSVSVAGTERTAEKPGPLVVLDGLLGIGAGGALREPVLGAAREINRLRAQENAQVLALDLPTGLDGDSGAADADCVIADFTLTIGFAKRGLLADAATRFVGRLAVLPLAELSARAHGTGAPETVATARELAPLLPRRKFEMHKGECGRVGIVAGSKGLAGAAVLCAEGCVHAGAGLVTLYVTPEIYPLVVAKIAPEVMVRAVSTYDEVLTARHDVLAIGPGLGSERAEEVRALIKDAPQPMVVDADALNILATSLASLVRAAGPRLLTPHPGEMARLDAAAARRARRETVADFMERQAVVLLLKGARTIVGERGRPLSYNSTGTPGMATGGMGDVLTGVCAALSGQGLALYDAARLGAWVCGRAAELAVLDGAESEESLTPSHIIAHLGRAFKNLRAGCW